ncbi:hypothetical protein FG167_05950 [Lacinutrix sp. WUR7]|uniref:hypothetical protein n=1 Tax=Lacinutrix sp. WUR7 TaxID=2653681 RepID=UPI00193D567B|nr:hypothetical protein [Lacinutrix sp. WUR7]QRM88794.1 hypothetical protein FG167_05950 [Lacinutrix sp. WUR7]
MLKIKLIIILFLISSLLFAQEEASINDFNFESVTNPAFTLIGESPSEINTPSNLKSLALYLSNGFSNTNIALETNPYWLIDFEDKRSYQKFRGIKMKQNGETYIDPFIGWKTNSSFSLAYINKKFEGAEDEKKTIAIGYRTTMLKLYNKVRIEKIKTAISIVDKGVTKSINILFEDYFNQEGINNPGTGSCNDIENNTDLKNEFNTIASDFLDRIFEEQDPDDPDEIAERGKLIFGDKKREEIREESIVSEYFKERCENISSFVNNPKTIKPILRLDGALAYSFLFEENKSGSATASRFGSWITADVALQLTNNNYLHIYGIAKYIDDGFSLTDEGLYFTENFWDYGGKLELELNKFTLAYEYLKRTGNYDKYRSVGNITYQLSEKMSITGGFGKDFPIDENLVTILGVNWGLNLGEKSFLPE